MKSNKIYIVAVFLLLLTPFLGTAQDTRTLKTKVADVMALLPANDNQQADRLFVELFNLGNEGLGLVTDQVLPNGKEEGVTARFAVSLLTHYSKTTEQKSKIEQVYLTALTKATETEVKAYFMDNLSLIGSDASVNTLGTYISNKDLYNPAISALVSIGTPSAKQTITNALSSATNAKPRLIKAIGELKILPALAAITSLATGTDIAIRKPALWTIALIADAGCYDVLFQEAKKVGFKNDPSEATQSLVEFMHQIAVKGDNTLSLKISQDLLANTLDASQQHFRLAALRNFAKANPTESVKIWISERSRFDSEYQKEILNIAEAGASNPTALGLWTKVYKKSKDQSQAEVLSMLALANSNEAFITKTLIPALASKNIFVRKVAAAEIARSRNKKFTSDLLDYLLKCTDDQELQSAKAAVLQLIDKDNVGLAAQKIEGAQSKNKITLLQLLSERRAVNYFDVVAKQTSSADASVKQAAFDALPNISSSKNMSALIAMLMASDTDNETKIIQNSIVAALDNTTAPINDAYQKNKIKIIPILPYVSDKDALGKVVSDFKNGNDKEKAAAFDALLNWQNNDAVRTLLSIRKDATLKQYHDQAFGAFVKQVGGSTWPDDEKLLMLKEIMPMASTKEEKSSVIRAAGNVRTFLSLMFVANYIDDADLSSVASRAAFQLALPTADAKPGQTGIEVRKVLQHMLDKLTGGDSQYEKIDIETYLQNIPYTKGYEPIFNGTDLTGWQGLVENPIARGKMIKEVLAAKQKEADGKVKNNWSVKDGCIVFQGDGANLCTTRPYADFEMLVDWKISKHGDSGIYLRGSPQVQIWDTSRVDVGAQVGSGGLYNNQKAQSKPLVVADNPVGEWNTFYIKMVGDKVTVLLNGVSVVDNVVLENYWDRSIPIFPEEAIELQAHGTELYFRNIYVKELSGKPYELTKEEKEQGFEVLFNGIDLDKWVGNKTDYIIEDNTLAIYPAEESHGNIYTNKEFSDFIFRFEFQLTPGANNGLGIHAPLQGDAAYVGKEIQILDNDAPVYSKLELYQYHGSVYGVIPAKRGFLKPLGDWNQEEVYVKGDYIKVTLNGTVILEGDMKKASQKGTLDHKDHPGLQRHTGHIGFLGHGSIVKFKNIRVKEISK